LTLRGPILLRITEPLTAQTLLAGAGFAAQIVSELRVLYAGSIFSRNSGPDAEEHSRFHEAWAPLIIVCMMGSLCAYGILAIQ